MSQFDSRTAFDPFAGIPGAAESNKQAKRAQPVNSQLLISGGYYPRFLSDRITEDGQKTTALQQGASTLRKDITNLQTNVQKPYQEQLDVFGGEVDQAGKTAMGAVEGGVDFLKGALGDVKDPNAPDFTTLDETLARTRGQTDTITAEADAQYAKTQEGLGRVNELIDVALGRADAGVDAAKAARSQYGSAVQENIRQTAAGLQRQNADAMKMITAGVNPETGQPMDAAEAFQYRTKMSESTNATVGQTVTGLRDAADKFMAGLTQAISEAQLAAGQLTGQLAGIELGATELGERAGAQRSQTKLAASQLEAETGLRVGAQKVESSLQYEQLKMATQEMRLNTSNAIASLMSSGTMAAVSLQLQGREALMQAISQYPHISLFEGWAAMMSLATAPNGRNLAPIPF